MAMTRVHAALLAAGLLTAVAAGRAVPAANTTAVEIGVTGRANAHASVAAAGTFVGVVWAARAPEGVTDIHLATSRDGGRTFSAPVRVNRAPGDASVSGEQPPRIALVASRTGDPAIVVMWTAKSPAGTHLVSARSADGGRSFRATPVPGSDASGNRGWESMALAPDGDPVAVWLDHRDVPPRPAGSGAGGSHQHGTAKPSSHTDGAARAQFSQLFFARLNDPASARAVAPGVCYCCKTAVATGPDGSIVAAWRHVYPGNVRDIALTKSTDGGRTFTPPTRVSDDKWVLDGCPENGPAVAVDSANVIHVVWPTVVHGPAGTEPDLALFHAISRDGLRFSSRQRIPSGAVVRHPQIVVGPGGVITIAWDEYVKGTRRIAMARGTTGAGAIARFMREAATDAAGSYPALATASDAVLMVWTSGGVDDSVLRVARHP
jgi:hypothetical protein